MTTSSPSRPEGALKAIRVSPAGRVWVDAGRLSVDLVMTGPWPGLGPVGARWETLHAADDLADWLRASRLELEPIDVTTADLTTAIDLRDALWGLVRALVDLQPRPRSAVTTVNACAGGAPLVPQLGPTGRRWSAPNATQALATIARDAIDLYADPAQLTRLHECASNDCQRVFYDTSRPGTRRWCDPVRCGDRQRARTYRRTRHDQHYRTRQHNEMKEDH